MTNRKPIDDHLAKAQRVIELRELLAQAEADLAADLAIKIEYVGAPVAPQVRRNAASGKPSSGGPVVLAFMKKHPGEPLNAAAVRAGLGLPERSHQAVRKSLRRLAAKRQLARRAGGVYVYQPAKR